jgi:hypothetical protein
MAKTIEPIPQKTGEAGPDSNDWYETVRFRR